MGAIHGLYMEAIHGSKNGPYMGAVHGSPTWEPYMEARMGHM